MRKRAGLIGAIALLSACVSPAQNARPASSATAASPPQLKRPALARPPINYVAGLEQVLGASEAELTARFGTPRLRLTEGQARKLQFADKLCVLDVYLYPQSPHGKPQAVHVDARRASDGEKLDSAACAQTLRR